MSLTKMTKQLEEATGKPQPSRAFMEAYEEREQRQRALERQDMLLHQKQVDKTVARSEADARQYQSNTDKLLERSQRFMERMIARGEANARQHQVDTDKAIAESQACAEKMRAEDRAEDQARFDRFAAEVNQRLTAMQKDLSFLRWVMILSMAAFSIVFSTVFAIVSVFT